MDTPKTRELWLEHVHFANEEEATEAICDFRDLCEKFERENARLRDALKSSTGHLILWEKSDPIGTAHFLPARIKANEDILPNAKAEARR
jgi:hypothetical protein